MQEDESSAGQWEPADYITRGIYCDARTIKATLLRYREESGATSAMLVAFSAETLFQSMLVISHVNGASESRLQNALLSTRITLTPPEQQALVELARGEAPSEQWLGSQPPFLQFAAELGWDDASCELVTSDAPQDDAPRHPALSTCVILGAATRRPHKLGASERLIELHTQVNATAAVALHRDSQRRSSIDGFVGPSPHQSASAVAGAEEHRSASDSQPPQNAYHYFAEDILTAALALSASSAGNIYLSSAQEPGLVLAAAEENAARREAIKRSDRKSVVAWVYRRGRALLINDIDDFLRTHPDIGFVNVHATGRKPYAELAVPILIKHPSSDRSSVLGVINVERVQGTDSGPYTSRDLAVLQQLAERFCLLRSEAFLALTGNSLVNLTRLNALGTGDRRPPSVPADSSTTTGRPRTPRRSPKPLLQVPSDIRYGADRLRLSLKQVFSLTSSSSATIRLLSADGKRSIRYCAVPEDRMSAGRAVIDISSPPQRACVGLKGGAGVLSVRNASRRST